VENDLVSLPDPALFAELDAMVQRVRHEPWKAYLRWRVGDAMAPYLSRSFREASLAFRGQALAGQPEPPPRWLQVLEAINTAAGPMLGREYAARHMSAEARALALRTAAQVHQAQLAALEHAAWLGPEARAEARAKLQALEIEVGTPRRDLDYTVQPMGRGSFGGNMLIASTWRHREEMRRIGKGNAERRWDMLPQQPALAYDLAQNRLIVTAAVLQPPVFDPADPATVYGAFAALVGNQLTRAVDGRGARVDAGGALRDWWTPAERAAWARLGERLAAQLATQLPRRAGRQGRRRAGQGRDPGRPGGPGAGLAGLVGRASPGRPGGAPGLLPRLVAAVGAAGGRKRGRRAPGRGHPRPRPAAQQRAAGQPAGLRHGLGLPARPADADAGGRAGPGLALSRRPAYFTRRR